MKYLLSVLAALTLLAGCQNKPVATLPAPLSPIEVQMDPVVENLKKTVVVIYGRRPLEVNGHMGIEQRTGTGMVICRLGTVSYVLTAEHVTNGLSDGQIMAVERVYADGLDSDGSAHTVKILKTNSNLDLALLQVESGLPLSIEVKLRKSELPCITSPVTVVGFPENTPAFVSRGMVGRYFRHERRGLLISTTAAVSGGNSGGPVFDSAGMLIGNILQVANQNSSITTGVTSTEMARWLESIGYSHLIK